MLFFMFKDGYFGTIVAIYNKDWRMNRCILISNPNLFRVQSRGFPEMTD